MKRGIQREAVLAGVLPAAIVAAVVGLWMLGLRISDLRTQHLAVGQILASQLAPAAEYGLFSGNRDILQRLAEAALEEADARTVRIRSSSGDVVVSATGPVTAPSGAFNPALWLASRFADPEATVDFHQLVVVPTTDLGDFDPVPESEEPLVLGSIEVEIALLPGLARQVEAALTGLFILLGALLASVFLAGRLGARIATPVERLATTMQRMREGRLDLRVPETSGNELGQLESGLNLMADEIQRTQATLEERIAQATNELQQTIEALEISNVELDLARKRALEASVLKTEFLAAMSHDIRTPMSAIIGYTQLLARSGLDPVQAEQVTTIQRSADALLRIINDILDLSRIEAGKLTLRTERFDIRACVDEVIRLLHPLAKLKGLHLRRCVYPEVPWALVGDPVRIQQVITNLVSNAIKYTSSGSITVDVVRYPDDDPRMCRLGLSVHDTGIGIAPEVQKQLFHAFTQADASTAEYPGTGLGLVICNRLVEAMGGDIELSSTPGVGTRVRATLTLAVAGDQKQPPIGGLGCTVALVEPDDRTRVHLAQLLERMGCTVRATAEPTALGGDEVVLDGTGEPGRLQHPRLLRLIDDIETSSDDLRFGLPRNASMSAIEFRLSRLIGRQPADDDEERHGRSLDGVSVMVVDDHRINRRLLARQLQALGASVTECDGGGEAAAKLDPGTKVVLLDLQMPGVSGVDLAARLRQVDEPSLLIAVTANALSTYDETLYRSGIARLYIKPVDEDDLTSGITGLLKRQHALRVALAKLDDDVRRMIGEDLPGIGDAILVACRERNGEALRSLLHDLAGISGACGLGPLRESVGLARRSLDRHPGALPETETIAVVSDLCLLNNEESA